MQVTNRDVQSIIGTRITEAGLATLVDLEKQHVLEFSEGFFVELPIRDGSRTAEVENVIRAAQDELRKDNVQLQVLIRPIWKIGDVSYNGAASEPGKPRVALSFAVVLTSGRQRASVTVDFTAAAIDIVRQKLGIDRYSGGVAWPPPSGDVSEQCLRAVITSHLENELKGEGATFWDPISQPVREIDKASAFVLLGESTAFRDLRVAIHDAFTKPIAAHFRSDLMTQGIDIQDFDRVLPELSNLFGGAFGPGDIFLTSSVELYSRLRPAEQALLRCYYYELASRTAR